jgi:DNA-binding beta-propeller fold protein YncE
VLDARPSRPRGTLLTALLLAAALLAAFAARAEAAELLYWDNFGTTTDSVGFASIDGSGGGLLNLGSASFNDPEGMAYDTAGNRLFVANEGTGTGQILAINLDGSGAAPFAPPGVPIEEPEGVAVDPVHGLVFWANDQEAGSIAWAKLDGSAGGILNTTGTTVEGPCCRIAVDPAGGRVYWVNSKPNPNTINYANLDNSGGGGVLSYAGSSLEPGGEGLAVDEAAGRLYFLGKEKLHYANLNGSGGGDVSEGGAAIKSPWGIALDPSLSRLYWANEGNKEAEGANAFGFISTNGGPSGNITVASNLVGEPQDPVIIKSPSAIKAPKAVRSKKSRSKLECSTGEWGADYAGSFVYQSPRSYAYQWKKNGKAIKGATKPKLSVSAAAKYSCAVTATNQAGSANKTSLTLNIKKASLKLTTKAKAAAKPGATATFKVKAANTGDLKAGKAKVCVKLSGAAKQALKAPACKSLGKLAGGKKKTATLKVEVLPGAAAGTYKLTFQPKGASGKAAKAKVVVSG